MSLIGKNPQFGLDRTNRQNLLLLVVVGLFLILKWGHLGLIFIAFFMLPGLALLQYAGRTLSDDAKLALSFPVSLMLTSGLMFSLHRYGFDLPVDWFAAIPIASMALLVLKRKNFEIKLDNKEQIIALLVFLLFLNLFYSTLQKDAVPRTDGANHLYKTWVTWEGIEKYGKILEWSKYMWSGHPTFVFYPPLAYLSPAMLTHFSQVPVHRVYNFFAFWSVLYAGLGVYLLARKVGVSELFAGGAATILITTPNMLGKVFFQGIYAIGLAFSFFAIIAFLGLELKGKNMLWLAFPIGAVLMLHSLIFYYVLYLLAFAALWLFMVKKEKTEAKFVMMALVIAALLSSSWLLPFIANFKLMHVAEIIIPANVGEFLSFLTSTGNVIGECTSMYCVNSFTLAYTVLFLLGVLTLFFAGSSKFKDQIVKNSDKIFILLCFAIILTVIFSEITPLVKVLPFREKMMGVGHRTYIYILPFASVVAVFLFDLFGKKTKYLAAAILFGIILFATLPWLSQPGLWMSEESPVLNTLGYDVLYGQIKNLDEGRMAIYGIYLTGMLPSIPKMTGRDMVGGTGYESATGPVEILPFDR